MRDSMPSRPTVYVYEQRELDHGWMRQCSGFDKIRLSSQNDNLAEVGMRDALLQSELAGEGAGTPGPLVTRTMPGLPVTRA